MNIYIVPAWYPQDEHDISACFFREQAHALADRGHHVTVIHITPVSCTQAMRVPWHQRQEWQDGNVRTIFFREIIPLPAKLSHIQDWYISWTFKRIIGNQIKKDISKGLQPPDLIHAHVSHSCAYYCLMASRNLKLPLVVTEHYSGLLLGTASKEDYERVKKTILGADAFIFVGSNFQKNICDKMNIKRKTYIIPNMIDTSRFPELCRKKKEEFTFLTACHLTQNKHVDMVIRAFHNAFSMDETKRLLIAGDGEELTALQQLVNELEEESRIHFHGRYSREEMPELFAQADAFVLTSKVETFGIVYLEAMMCGLPCIGTAGQGADDIIDESNGLKVPYGDLERLAEAMKMILEKQEHYNRQSIRENCSSQFSARTICGSLESIYAKIKNDIDSEIIEAYSGD